MKVQALVTGTHYLIDDRTQRPEMGQFGQCAEVRHREGDVFELKDYYITLTDPTTTRPLLDKETGQPKMRLLTAEEQFNPAKMQRVPDDTPESFSTAQDAINAATAGMKIGKTPRRASKIAEVHS